MRVAALAMPQVNAANIIREALRVFRDHAATVIAVSAIFEVVKVAFTFFVLNQSGQLFAFLVTGIGGLVITQLSIGAYTLMLVSLRTTGRLPTIDALVTSALPSALPLLGIALLTGAGIGFASAFFLIPGVILACRWAVATPALVATKVSPLEAIAFSRKLTDGHGSSVFVIVLFQGAISQGIPFVTSLMGRDMVLEQLVLGQAVIATIAAPLAALAIGELFMQLYGYAPGMVIPGPEPDGGPPASGPFVGSPQPSPPAAAPSGGGAFGAPPKPYLGMAGAPGGLTGPPAPVYGIPVYEAGSAPPVPGRPTQDTSIYAQAAPSYVPPPPADELPPAPPTFAAAIADPEPVAPLAYRAPPAPAPAATAPSPAQTTRTHSVPPPGLS